VPAGFHAYSHLHALLFQLTVELFGFFTVPQPPFPALSGVGVHKSNLLETRMIITALYLVLHLPDSVALC